MKAGRVRIERLGLGSLFVAAAGFYGATWVCLRLLGVQTVAPTYLVLSLLLITLPASFVTAALILTVERAVAWRSRARLLVPFAMIAVAIGWRLMQLMAADVRIAAALIALLVTASTLSASARRALTAGVVLLIVFLGVWHANYAALWLSRNRLLDPLGRATDVWLYAAIGIDVSSYEHVFPLVTGRAFSFLEQGYMFLLSELMVIVFLVARDEDATEALPRLLVGVAACYVIGVAVYLAVPLSGPCLFYPKSIAPIAKDSSTYIGMLQLLTEYESVRGSGRAVTGFAYFVALPSLHAALATLLQLVASQKPIRGLIVLPLNVLAVLATFLLGWHYVIDVPAGVLLGAVVYRVIIRRSGAGRATGRAQPVPSPA